MNEGTQRYTVGDTIRMKTNIQHKMHLDLVVVTFVHEEKEEASVYLEGEPVRAEEQWASGAGDTRSEVDLSVRVAPGTEPGVYRLNRMAFITYEDKFFTRRGEEELRDMASLSLEILPESDEKPGVEGIAFM